MNLFRATTYFILLISLTLLQSCGVDSTNANVKNVSDEDAIVHTLTPLGKIDIHDHDLQPALVEPAVVEDSEINPAEIINIAKKVWTVVEKNKPVVNIHSKFANAIPNGLANASSLEGFSDLEAFGYQLSGKNLFGIQVYKLKFAVIHQYGGTYEGNGQYLTNVGVAPLEVDAAWGYKVNLAAKATNATNVGTADAPIASLVLKLNFSVKTVLKESHDNFVFQFRGDKAAVKSIH